MTLRYIEPMRWMKQGLSIVNRRHEQRGFLGGIYVVRDLLTGLKHVSGSK